MSNVVAVVRKRAAKLHHRPTRDEQGQQQSPGCQARRDLGKWIQDNEGGFPWS